VAATNLLIIMSDEHSKKWLGCYDSPIVETPNLDRLASRGTVFTNAFTASPVCVPARAAFATGRYIHETGFWDNADPYDGSVRSWHHELRENGHQVVSIGKLHFRSEKDDNGFSEEIVPMHVLDAKGDLLGLVRDDLPVRDGAWKMARPAGPGDTSYTRYDRLIASRAQTWLHEAPRHAEKPWVLFVSFVAPHFPLIAPPEYYYRYHGCDLPTPKLYEKADRPSHPFLVDYRNCFNYDDYFDEERLHAALAGYFGLCSFVDDNIGKILRALDDSGQTDDTTILYTSDHGDNLGARGAWGKSTMYEEAVGVPLILAGPGIPAGVHRSTPVSHIDVRPTITEVVGDDKSGGSEASPLPGRSLIGVAQASDCKRTVFSEYHGMGSTTAAFMVRRGRYKYVHYVGYPPQLFDLEEDPEELRDLGTDPNFSAEIAALEAKLRAICDPEDVNRRAKERQAELLALNGGREAVIARGDIGFTPTPAPPPDFS